MLAHEMNRQLKVNVFYKKEEKEQKDMEKLLRADLNRWFAKLMNTNSAGKES